MNLILNSMSCVFKSVSLLMLCILIFNTKVFSAPIIFNNVSNELGLTNRWVVDAIQTSDGFIWVATQNGLFRFDGYKYKKYKHIPSNNRSLYNNYIQKVYEDSQGNLWVGTRGGVLHLYDKFTDNFIQYPFDPNFPFSKDSTSTVYDMLEGNNNILWIAILGAGLYQFDLDTKTYIKSFKATGKKGDLHHDRLSSLHLDKNNNLWLGFNSGGVQIFNSSDQTFQQELHTHIKFISAIRADRNGKLWLASRGSGLVQLDPTSHDIVNHYRHDPDAVNSLTSDHVYNLHFDNNNIMWIATRYGGLNKFDPQTQTFQRYQYQQGNKYGLPDPDVFTIFTDKQGLIWLGTFGGGLTKFDPKSTKFGFTTHEAENPNSLSKGVIHALFKSRDGVIWTGNESGLNSFDPKTGFYTHYKPDPNDKNSLSHNSVWTIYEDLQGDIWAGTFPQGLNKLNRQSQTFTRFFHSSEESSTISHSAIHAIKEDAQGRLWVGTRFGLNRFNPDTQTFVRYLHSELDPRTISGDKINSIFLDLQQKLWIATNKGLSLYQPETDDFIRFQHNPNDKNSLSDNNVYSMAQDKNGSYWIGTRKGLNQYNSETGKFTHYTEQDGLNSDRIFGVLVDKQNNIWLSEDKITLFDRQQNIFRNNIGALAGCIIPNQGSHFQADDGQLFFGSDLGYCSFYPEQVNDKGEKPTIALTDFLLDNKSVLISPEQGYRNLTRNVNTLDKITLSHEENLLSFEFSALHFSDPKSNKYKYKLAGFNKDWIETDATNRRATYTNLASGDYTFTVIASNNEGMWNDIGKSIQLTILPPPWKTWWAYALYCLVFLLLVFWFIRSQQKKVEFERAINLQLEQKVKERTAELERVSLTDQLTGTCNRRFLDRFINERIAKVDRAHFEFTNDTLSLPKIGFIVLDMDHFKQVNDNYGHDAGDKVLIQLAQIITNTCRESDWVVRWGGEEFVIIINFINSNELQQLAERIRLNIENHSFNIGNDIVLKKTCSIGISSYPFIKKEPTALSWEQTLNYADIALYAVKNNGRNAWIRLFDTNNTDVEVLTTGKVRLDKLIIENDLSYETSISTDIDWHN